jgi:hypothetical protein
MAALEKKAAAPRPAVATAEMPLVPVVEVEEVVAPALAVLATLEVEEVVAPALEVKEVVAPALEVKEVIPEVSYAELIKELNTPGKATPYKPRVMDPAINPASGAASFTDIGMSDPSIYTLFKRFEHATTPEEFEMAHKLANTFGDLQPFDPDAA